MTNVETRQVDRDSLFLLAQVRVDGGETSHRVKVRNLSAGGMMAEGDATVTRGSRVSVDLRNIGWVEGTVAWKQENRFGIAFLDEIDPKSVREPLKPGERSEEVRRYSPPPPPEAPDPRKMRKL